MGRPRKRPRGNDKHPRTNDSGNSRSLPVEDASAPFLDIHSPQYSFNDMDLDNVSLDDLGNLQTGPLADSLFQSTNYYLGTKNVEPLPAVGPYTFGASAASGLQATDGQLDLNLTMPPTSDTTTNGNRGEQDESRPSCSCLANLYSTLSSFQSLPPPSFPYFMNLLSRATTVARDACHCKICPTRYSSALQNLMLLSTLLPLITHEYSKLLEHVDARASKDEAISLRIGERDQSLEDVYKHTYTPDCPMAFEVDFAGKDWQSLARKAIRRKVLGESPTDISVLGVINDLEARQKFWHAHPILAEYKHGKKCREHGPEVGKEHTCLQMLSRVRSSIEELDIS